MGELSPGMTKKFALRCQGRAIEGFLVSYGGKIFAYANRCRHISMSMDWVDNHFFSADRRYLICSTHGATYEPATGECVWGPCFGAFLQAVPVEIQGREIRAFCPARDETEG